MPLIPRGLLLGYGRLSKPDDHHSGVPTRCILLEHVDKVAQHAALTSAPDMVLSSPHGRKRGVSCARPHSALGFRSVNQPPADCASRGKQILREGRHGHLVTLRGKVHTFLEETHRHTPHIPSHTLHWHLTRESARPPPCEYSAIIAPKATGSIYADPLLP